MTKAQANNGINTTETTLSLKASGTPLANVSAIVKKFDVSKLIEKDFTLDEKKSIIELSGGDSVHEQLITSAIKSARTAMNKVDKATTETFLYAYIGSKAMDVKNVKSYLQKFFPILDYSSTMKYFKALDAYCINPEMTAIILKFGYTKLVRLFDADGAIRLQIMLSIQNGDINPSDSVATIIGKVKALKPVIDVKPNNTNTNTNTNTSTNNNNNSTDNTNTNTNTDNTNTDNTNTNTNTDNTNTNTNTDNTNTNTCTNINDIKNMIDKLIAIDYSKYSSTSNISIVAELNKLIDEISKYTN